MPTHRTLPAHTASSRTRAYFYFAGRYAVLAALVRRAIGEGEQTAEHWVKHAPDEPPEAGLRRSIWEGAVLWRNRGPVLRAIVENWRADPELTRLWLEVMEGFTERTTARIEQDRKAGLATTGADPRTLAAMLTWLGERVNYLTALGQAPFDDTDRMVDTLTHVWLHTIYPGSSSMAPTDGDDAGR